MYRILQSEQVWMKAGALCIGNSFDSYSLIINIMFY